MNIIPARKDPGWRGTTRYGSLAAHLKQDLGRKDDVESWYYALVELTKGSLPWRLVTGKYIRKNIHHMFLFSDRSKVQEAKIFARNDGRKDFLSGCPRPYDQILTMIDKMTFDSTPPYEEILKLLEEYCKEVGISMTQKYDWGKTYLFCVSFNLLCFRR